MGELLIFELPDYIDPKEACKIYNKVEKYITKLIEEYKVSNKAK